VPQILNVLWNRALASDPGFNRLMLAARVTLSVMLATLVLYVIMQAFDLPPTFALLGSITALQVSLAVNDPQARSTTLLTVFPGSIGVVLGSLRSANALASDLLFLVTLFVSVAIRTYGPRWTAFGTVTIVTYFFTLFLSVTTSMLPVLLPAVSCGVACAFVARFVIFPDRPRWLAERTIKALKARVCIAAAATYQLTKSNGASAPAASDQLASAMMLLNETAASIEARLGSDDGSSMRVVFDVELDVEEIAAAAMRLKERGASVPRALRLALLAMSRGQSARATKLAAASVRGANASDAARTLAAAVAGLDDALQRIDDVADVLARSDAPWGFGPGQQQPALRQAIQITIAAAAAMIAGEALSPQRWYWAVLATFFVFTGTASSGETIVRAWLRILGTTAGVAAGVVVGRVAQHHAVLSVAAMFFCLFSGVYLLRLSYGAMIFFITTLLALLYAEIGRFSYELLGIRLAETVIGAIFGALAAGMILPTRTNDVIRKQTLETLTAAGVSVRASINALIAGSDEGALAAARDLDNHVQQLILRAKPSLFWSPFSTEKDELRRRIIALTACGYHARALAREANRRTEPLPTQRIAELRRLNEHVQERIQAAVRRVDGGEGLVVDDTLLLFETMRRDATPEFARIVQTLQEFDHAVARLARNDDTPPLPSSRL